MQVWNVLRAACCKCRTQKVAKNRHLGTVAQICQAISSQLRHVSTIGKKLVKQQCLPHMPHNMVNFDPLVAEICWRVLGTPANFNGFRVLAVLLHDTLVVGVSQSLWRWTEGATYIRHGGHHVGHWPTFLVFLRRFFFNKILRAIKIADTAANPYISNWSSIRRFVFSLFTFFVVSYHLDNVIPSPAWTPPRFLQLASFC